ncbi:unnamed protein product [Prorocentrum cordatum]|uniref:Uncharacterized protein n=1 Tax=Prorocentrum cordatum TaxID=2364126 RepID=A0ABN9UXV4_9DINO|nr:unnamed protein product [Polarella glacialis]
MLSPPTCACLARLEARDADAAGGAQAVPGRLKARHRPPRKQEEGGEEARAVEEREEGQAHSWSPAGAARRPAPSGALGGGCMRRARRGDGTAPGPAARGAPRGAARCRVGTH